MNNIPNLFLIGAPKCGTTALANILSEHKDIFISEHKEPRYFDAHTFYDFEVDYPIQSLEDYLKLFDKEETKQSKYRLDASVFNMYSKESIENILDLSPDAKFIVILREPVSASVSMFKQRLSYVDTKMRELCEDFNECWNLLKKRKAGEGYPKGCRNRFLFRYDLLYSYEKYLPYLIERLEDNLYIGFYEDYRDNYEQFIQDLLQFLELDNITLENKRLNESYTVSKNFIFSIIEAFARKTIKIRKKLGLIGLLNIKQNVFMKFKSQEVKTEVDKKVYDFFKKTKQYLDELKSKK